MKRFNLISFKDDGGEYFKDRNLSEKLLFHLVTNFPYYNDCIIRDTKDDKEFKFVYGTKKNCWILVNNSDRDFIYAFEIKDLNIFGLEAAKKKYLNPCFYS